MSLLKKLLVVLGPTASGKTALSIALAQKLQTEILSADSRQFFKEMQIGTAAPTPEELALAPHHFVGHLSVTDNYSVGQYEIDALKVLKNLFQQNDTAILTGGSGLYIDAVLYGLNKFPDTKPESRVFLEKKLKNEGISTLQQMLLENDPEYYDRVDLQNPRRLIRALEVCLSTGKPYSSFLNSEKKPRAFKPVLVGLLPERSRLYKKIDHRVDKMIGDGLEEEVRSLLPYKNTNALQTVGYKEWFAYFDGNATYNETVTRIKQNSRRYAKRQFTWLKKYDVLWFDPDLTTQQQRIEAILKKISAD